MSANRCAADGKKIQFLLKISALDLICLIC